MQSYYATLLFFRNGIRQFSQPVPTVKYVSKYTINYNNDLRLSLSLKYNFVYIIQVIIKIFLISFNVLNIYKYLLFVFYCLLIILIF